MIAKQFQKQIFMNEERAFWNTNLILQALIYL